MKWLVVGWWVRADAVNTTTGSIARVGGCQTEQAARCVDAAVHLLATRLIYQLLKLVNE